MRDSFRPIHNNFITQDNQKKNSEDFRRRQNGKDENVRPNSRYD